MTEQLALIPPHVFTAFAAVVGLVLGSFYNVCIYRYITRESLLFPASHCPNCKARLRPWELIPLLSWLFLKGCCSHCKKPISWRYPLVETVSGLMAGLLAWRFGPTVPFAALLFFTGVFIVASGIDFITQILPDECTLGGAVLAFPCAVWLLDMPWMESLLGGLCGAGVFLAVLLLFKKLRGVDGLGFGDVKLMLPIGFLCGAWLLPLVVLTAGVSALCYGLPLALRFKGDSRSLRLPFGPFLCLGFAVSVLAGQDLLFWWVRFMTGQ